jgi:hypothetical protein
MNMKDTGGEAVDHKDPSAPTHKHGNPVQVSVDDRAVDIADGVYKTPELKLRLSIPAEYVLNEVDKHGTLRPLTEERSLHVMGGEIFVSQLPQGGSS